MGDGGFPSPLGSARGLLGERRERLFRLISDPLRRNPVRQKISDRDRERFEDSGEGFGDAPLFSRVIAFALHCPEILL